MSGSDDGSVELWSVLRKKPAYIVKNAHALLAANKKFELKGSERIPNGHIGKDIDSRFLHLFLCLSILWSLSIFVSSVQLC